ncbi:SDR family oxidoreductase [Streptomyces sp. Rer75]|uniref:SDR family oxidoreductase n=1 Tax=unclassified Streptomyces TaxID=2593676 RepID=UPI0015CFE0C4|nr:SDR family oxidoreductase [Streptomyces sp. Rer75]QLH22023.1 SDR family oxidoreductase [Streptomyces sp. Rer75]
MITSLEGSWCLVLGASSGMGLAIAHEMARAGVSVLGVHFDTTEGQQKAAVAQEEMRAHGVEAHFFNANAASARTREELLPRFEELTGGKGVRVLVHSLAFGTLLPYVTPDGEGSLTSRQMNMTLDVMAHSLVYWTQDLFTAGLLRKGSKVYAMTSAGGARVMPHYGAVSSAKAALESHVRQLALELAPSGIAVNALRAGVTPTPSMERIPDSERLAEYAKDLNPHRRLTRPEDVAEAVSLLSRTDSSWITGNVIGVDGGELLT